ncbi:MAG: polyprenyl diphosphate synthase [Tenericutes bacterium]|nr:polyprenyl diphosphate synthase [Mycoplasmatota bacterium]
MELNIPNHVAIIMDGNGRWAQNRNYKRTKGHQMGAKVLKKISEYAFNKKVKVLSVFAFSTENWKRSKEEVDYIMNLFVSIFKENYESMKKIGVRVVFSGLRSKLSDKVLKLIDKMTLETKDNKNGIFNICINYGGQDEIVEATKKIASKVKEGIIDVNDINKEMYNDYMFNDLPPIDLMIRTSGEYRISNFMLWQMAYSELYFTDTLWPDFDEKEFDLALESFNKRDRRYGGVKK